METTLRPLTHQTLFEAEGYVAEMCIEEESLRLAYHLRYQAYFQADAIPPNPEQLCVDPYDQQSNARTFLIWLQDKPIASVRSLTWSESYDWATTPSVNYFKTDIEEHLGVSTPLLESNRYVVDPSVTGRKSLTAQMLLFRIQTLGSIADHCEYVITAVRPKHVKFYERFMNFFPISEPISVSEVKFPIQLLATPVSSREKLSANSTMATYEEADLEKYINCLQRL